MYGYTNPRLINIKMNETATVEGFTCELFYKGADTFGANNFFFEFTQPLISSLKPRADREQTA